MNNKDGKIDYEALKKVAKDTKDKELLADIKKRSNTNTVDKWQR